MVIYQQVSSTETWLKKKNEITVFEGLVIP